MPTSGKNQIAPGGIYSPSTLKYKITEVLNIGHCEDSRNNDIIYFRSNIFLLSDTYAILFIHLFNSSTAGKIKDILKFYFLEYFWFFRPKSFANGNFNILLQTSLLSKADYFSSCII